MQTLTNEVKKEIEDFLCANWDEFIADSKEYDGLEITFATNDDGDCWNYQTGDNSFTGGCCSLPHWAVDTIIDDGWNASVMAMCIIEQLEEQLPGNR